MMADGRKQLEELNEFQRKRLMQEGIDPDFYKLLCIAGPAWHLENIITGSGLTIYWRRIEK